MEPRRLQRQTHTQTAPTHIRNLIAKTYVASPSEEGSVAVDIQHERSVFVER